MATLEMIVLHVSMDEEDIIEHTNGRFHVFTFSILTWENIASIRMSSVMCSHL